MKSLRRRFALTLSINLARAGVSFFTAMFVARSLGVSGYGNLQFLSATALAARQFIDLGASSAFFTLLSRGDRRPRVFKTYFLWLALQFSVLLLGLGILLPAAWAGRIWLGQSRLHVALAITSAFVIDALWVAVTNIGESIRRTDIVQPAGFAAVVAYGTCIVFLRWIGLLSVGAVLALNAAIYGCLSALVLHRLLRREGASQARPDGAAHDLQAYYLGFCKPLLLSAAAVFAYKFADAWLLQHFAGARGQGLYGVSQQLSVISLLATTSFVKVFWKEISESVSAGNLERARYLYDKAARFLYLVGAAISAFLIPLSGELVRITLGPQYSEARLPVAIMLLYPIHQSLGQLNGTFFYATGQVKAYVRLGIPLLLLGLPISYFVLASPTSPVPGLGLGSTGMPIKEVFLQFIAANANCWLIHRLYRWRFRWSYQVVALASLLLLSLAAAGAARACLRLAGFADPTFALFAASGCLYLPALVLGLRLAPGLFGVTRDESREAWGLAHSSLALNPSAFW